MNLYLIGKSENVIDIIPKSKIISLTQSLEINQADVMNGSLTLDKELVSKLDDVRYFAISDRENKHNLWMYRKTTIKVENNDILIQGVNSFYDDLKAYGYIKDKRPNMINAAQAVQLVLNNTRWKVDFIDSDLTKSTAQVHDTNFYYLTYLDVIKKIEDEWEIEIQPFINIEGNKVTRKYVNLYMQQGSNKGKRFVYGKSALQIVKESNDTDVYTALIGRGAGIPEQNSDGQDTGGYTRKITFADIEWKKDRGDPVDKPKGQEWIEWPAATKEYGYSDGTPRFGIVDFDNEQDPNALLKETWQELEKSAIPAVQFSATVGDVGFLSLGETVSVIRYDLDIKYQTRVINIEWDRINENASQITLGDKLINTAAERYQSVKSDAYKAKNLADQANNAANFAIDNGGTDIEWGSNEPEKPKEGDIWFDKQSDGTVIMKQYENGQWIIRIDDTTGEQVKNKVDKAEEDMGQLKTSASELSKKADLAIQNSIDNKNALQSKVNSDDYNSEITQISEAIQSKVSQADYQSEITQLSDNINLKVSKNDVINQINIYDEGILIDGKKTHITGQTLIDDAVITNANIANLSASKLTAGVIDCREIDVMNIAGYQIMANEITADKLAANSILIGLNNTLTDMQLYIDGLVTRKNGNVSMMLTQAGLQVSDPGNDEQVGLIHTNHMNDAHWFNGLVFDLNPAGDYIGFGSQNSDNDLYDLKFAYYKNGYGGVPANSFTMSTDLYLNGWLHLDGLITQTGDWLNVDKSTVNGMPCVFLHVPWGAQCGIAISGNNVYLKTVGGYYDMNDVIHSIGRNQTWN